MRLFTSFFLSLFIYFSIIFFFLYFTIFAKQKEISQQIYIHQVIVKGEKRGKSFSKPKITQPKIPKKDTLTKGDLNKPKLKIKTETKTKDTISKGGQEIKFDDIFANTSSKIPTTKLKHKKRENMTKKIGKSVKNSDIVKKELSNLSSSVSLSTLYSNKKDSDFISNEFGRVWNSLSTQDGDFISLRINIQNGRIDFVVIATNLDTILLNKFLEKLKQIDTTKIKRFVGTIKFNTKLKGNE